MLSTIPVLFLAAFASAASLQRRTSYCDQYDTVAVGADYTLYTDLWGESGASSGSQCSTIVSTSGTNVAWSTTWQWAGGSGVKSFSNINLDVGLNVKLSAITSIVSTWDWSISSSSGIVADVAYDLFTSATSGGSNAYEIMIWLANYNAGPISYTYGSSGAPTPVASNITIAGHTWNLYYGSNGSNYVYSFLPVSGVVTAFSGDLKAFLTYLTTNEGLSTSQYLVTAQAGTEPTSSTSSITLTTSKYSLVVVS
ncbi:glycoside hydrolase family 12 protein [Athelia psychrophila]|uniref:Glycoside hydrolase family 12 protein n=1 Tax=Athelia psychrophila TaxID=1759441 RepID=A0A166DDA5_9AGAM|nr:glycoside hydrolase family 12 protein [Fibularhizoctonia sp. CBS 109695]